jgi:hypothetical protein
MAPLFLLIHMIPTLSESISTAKPNVCESTICLPIHQSAMCAATSPSRVDRRDENVRLALRCCSKLSAIANE